MSPQINGAMSRRDDAAELAFGAWLVSQEGRAGWVGDLARAARADRKFPRNGDPDDVRKHLTAAQADSDMFEALEDAENLWLAG